MKKGSGFEKFFKDKEKTGAAKKENIRQEKRHFKKEREEQIANAKREKRAKYKSANSGEPPKYNLDPPGSKFQKTGRDNRDNNSYKREQAPYKKESTGFRNSATGSAPQRNKKIEITPKRITNRSTKPEKWDGPGPNKDRDAKPYAGNNSKPYTPGGQKPYSADRPKQFKTDNDRRPKNNEGRSHSNEDRRPSKPSVTKPYKKEEQKPYRNEEQKPYRKDEQRPYKSDSPKPVLQKKELPKKIGHKDEAGAHLRQEPAVKAPINRQHLADELMPLNKYIAHSGICSRRDAVDLIKGGKVKVNGELVLEPGHKVAITDDVKVAGKKLNPVKDFVYILLNKPKDYITTTDDPQERKTVLDLLKGAPEIRIYPVGRLDRNTSGVLLLTNDGDLAQKLTHPSNEIKKVYAVTLDKPLTKVHFEAILKGVALEDGVANVDSLAFTDAQDLTQVGVELHTGRNRIVRRMFEHFEYEVKGLDRVIFAGLTKKNITRGKWRFLTEKEVRDLKFFKKGRR